MAGAVADAAAEGVPLLVHAPTGVGKSLGYLVPLAAEGRRVTVATATKALQAQLVERDLPRVADAFGVTYALAVGRGNYWCKSRAEALVTATRLAATPQETAALELLDWAADTPTGLRSDAPPVRDEVWDLVSVSGEECPGPRGCQLASVCFAERAREEAREVDVVVTNHHLLLLELELRQVSDAPSVMLPESDVIVVDEAHRLADHAAELYGATVRGARASRAGAAVDAIIRATGGRSDWARRLRSRWEERAAALRAGPVLPGSRSAGRLAEALGGVATDVAACGRALEGIGATDEDLDTALRSAKRRLAGFARDLVRLGEAAVGEGGPRDAGAQRGRDRSAGGPPELAVWVEEGRRGDRVVRSALVEPGAVLRERLWGRGVTVGCSATLAVGGSLAPAAAALGVEEPATLVQESPFDFERNALLYVPRQIPAPGQPGFQAAAEEEVRGLVRASQGRALVLCTSWRALQSLRERLADLEFELLVQGDESADRLAGRFRDEVGSVLLATRTFFEGIDVPGESLSLLVLDRLPFPPPDDPLLAERGRRVERDGGSRFGTVWLPSAAVSLQQALGRLIRSDDDRGVMAVLDRRLADAAYGQTLRASLPPAPLTRSQADVRAFFSAGQAAGDLPPARQPLRL